jgi:tight adherence protein B
MNPIVLLFGLVAIFALLLIVIGLRKRPEQSSAEEVMERMGRFGTREALLHPEEVDTTTSKKLAGGVEQAFKGRKIATSSATLLSRADVKLTVGEFLLLRCAAAILGFVIGFLVLRSLTPVLGVLFGLVLAIAGFSAPVSVVSFKGKRRKKAFISQLGDTISLMANSLRAGYSLVQTMDMVSRESKDPIAAEFSRVVHDVGLGVSIHAAMNNLIERIPSEDLDLLVTAISIQHEVGGNLAQILTTIGHTIRERVRIQGEVGVLTAQVRLSGTIITLVPVALAGLLFLLNPSYMLGLFAWPYLVMPIISLIMTTIGFFIMRKIASIEV